MIQNIRCMQRVTSSTLPVNMHDTLMLYACEPLVHSSKDTSVATCSVCQAIHRSEADVKQLSTLPQLATNMFGTTIGGQ